jgi:putative ABC transport system ATP-binding protein/lipoprotein-releasing system ATP-binding protein
MNPLLETRTLGKSHRLGGVQTVVLEGLTASFGAGLCHTIMGASGSGKSTLLQLLGGLDRPTTGEILWQNQSTSGWSSNALASWRQKYVGFIFQSYHLLPELSALENVEMPALLARTSDPAKGTALLEQVGLGARLHHRPGELSGGEQQRVAIARALRNDPDLLLADEPTGNLDAATGGAVVDLLLSLQKISKKTMLLVTHDAGIAARGDVHWQLTRGRLERI